MTDCPCKCACHTVAYCRVHTGRHTDSGLCQVPGQHRCGEDKR